MFEIFIFSYRFAEHPEVSPQPPRNVVLELGGGEVAEYRLDLLQDGQVVVPLVLLLVLGVQLQLLLAAEVLVGVGARLLAAEHPLLDAAQHEELLQHAVHVARGARVLQTHEALLRPRPHRRQELPLGEELVPAVEHLAQHPRQLRQVSGAALKIFLNSSTIFVSQIADKIF